MTINTATDVKLDITRSIEEGYMERRNGETNVERAWFPLQWEDANDDPLPDEDEDPAPNSQGHFYSLDAPGPISAYHNGSDELVWHFNANEWVRVTFNGNSPEGPGILGSRMSLMLPWHMTQTFDQSSTAGIWKRSTGADPSGWNDPVTSDNNIGINHVHFDDPPY